MIFITVRNKKCCLQKYFYTEFFLMSKYNTHMHSLACANTRRYVRTHAHHTHTAHTHTHSILICVLKVDQLLCGYTCSCGAFCSFEILRLTTTPLRHDDTQRGAMPPRGQKLALTPMLIITAQVDAGAGGRGGFLSLSHCRGPEEHQTLMERCTLSKIDVP